uniref:ABC transporter permease n=1 Tax=Steinernema glaseri TaxID=37863 RepID=A0A1I8AN75_9BILA
MPRPPDGLRPASGVAVPSESARPEKPDTPPALP